MTVDFSIAQHTHQDINADNAASSAIEKAGMFMSQRVIVVKNNKSQLQSAAEELSLNRGVSDAIQLETIKEKILLEGTYLNRAQLYKEHMRQLAQDEDLEIFKKLVRKKQDKTSEWVLEQANIFFPDPSDAWIALLDLINDIEIDIKKQDSSALQSELQICTKAFQQLETENKVAIFSGIVACTEAKNFTDLASSIELKNFYRDNISNYIDAIDVFKNIKKNWSTLDIDKGVDFLYHSISVDMGTDKPSMDKIHLEQVLNNLEKVRVLQSAYIIFAEVLTRFRKVHKQVNCPLQPVELLEYMLNITKQGYVGNMYVEDIVKKAQPSNIEIEVLFLQDLLKAVRNAPLAFYGGSEGLLNFIQAFQNALDLAIAREDAYLAGQGN